MFLAISHSLDLTSPNSQMLAFPTLIDGVERAAIDSFAIELSFSLRFRLNHFDKMDSLNAVAFSRIDDTPKRRQSLMTPVKWQLKDDVHWMNTYEALDTNLYIPYPSHR